MSAIVTGASNQVGAFLIPSLLATGETVIALSRGPRPAWLAPHPNLTWRQLDLTHRVPRLRADCLFHHAPMSLAGALMARVDGLRKVVVTGSTSMISKRDSPDQQERQLALALAEAEAALFARAELLGLDATILRPTILYGAGLDLGLSRIARFIRRWRLFPLYGPGSGLRQPLHAEDLARVVITAATLPGRHAFDLAGGDTLTYRDMVARIFSSLSIKPRFVRPPRPLLRSAVKLWPKLAPKSAINLAMLERLNQDLVFDDRVARSQLKHAPRGFAPQGDEWRAPRLS